MTNNSSPITRTSLDPTVVYTFFAFMFVFLAVVAFRSFTGADCSKVGFVIMSDGFRAGEVITLKDTTFGAQSWEWNFGDNTPVAKIKSPVHVFDKPGKYTVKLIVNDACDKQLALVILPKKVVSQPGPDKLILPKIKSPKYIYVGEPTEFSADSSTGTSFDWNFGETERTDVSGKEVSYTFLTVGPKNITVYVNGSSNAVTKAVNVVRRKGPPPPPSPTDTGKTVSSPVQEYGVKAPLISDPDFTELLNKISKGQTQLNDLLTYTCGKSNIIVTVNNAERITLTELFNKLKGDKKLYIKKSRHRTNINNCILDLEVETKKKLM